VTHRERVLSSLSHREPDKVPLDFGGTIDTSVTVAGYERLKALFHLEAENRISSMMMQVVDIDEPILEGLDIDTQQVLPRGSVDEVKAEVERRIEDLGPGGGYVLCAVHNVQPEVPTENLVAMYRHAREYLPRFVRAPKGVA
jgi:hypothetical protein